MEALVLLIVPVVAFFVWAVAYFQPKRQDPAADREQRTAHIAWLEDRLAHGRRHNWDEQMMANLQAQLAEARRHQQGG